MVFGADDLDSGSQGSFRLAPLQMFWGEGQRKSIGLKCIKSHQWNFKLARCARRFSLRSKPPRPPSSAPFAHRRSHSGHRANRRRPSLCVYHQRSSFVQMWELFSQEPLRSDIRQLTCKARLLDLFRMAPSVHTHLHKAQRDVEPRYSHAHSWHNKSRAGSMFALSPRHIPFVCDISQWLRVFSFSWLSSSTLI